MKAALLVVILIMLAGDPIVVHHQFASMEECTKNAHALMADKEYEAKNKAMGVQEIIILCDTTIREVRDGLVAAR